jgi:ArsR family transcriptional regulator
MLAVLAGQELTVSELGDVLQLPQSTVSRHLKTLSDGGWVASRRDGTSRLYSVEELPPVARKLWNLVREQTSATPAALHDEHRLKRILADRRSASEEFFSSAAGQWDRLREELFGATAPLRALAGLFGEHWIVGDLGCGTGQVAELVAPFVDRVIAIDASREMLQAARTRLRGIDNVEVRRGALEHLPLDDDQLDAAMVFLVLHHVADPGLVLAEAARVVRPGGRVLVADMMPHDHEEYRQAMGHVWLGFSDKQMSRYFGAAGLDAIRWRALPADPRAKGPALFVATARKLAPAGPALAAGDDTRSRETAVATAG